MKIEAGEVAEAVEHFEAMKEQKVVDKDREAVSNPKTMKIKVQSSQEAAEEEGMIMSSSMF